MGIRVLFGVFLGIFASLANAVDAALPWSFVNGSAKGYSIQLVSAFPAPGTKVAVGQTLEFKITVSYQLSIADKGSIVLVIQDENNKNLLAEKPQQSQSVKRGKGTITLTESFMVPTGSTEVRLFIPLVPQGIEHTDGELVLRYPVSNEVQSSTIGYPSVAAALKDLHSKSEVQFRDEHGWTIAEDPSLHTFWSFPPAGHPAYPAAVQRVIVQEEGGISLNMNVLCESTHLLVRRLSPIRAVLYRRARFRLTELTPFPMGITLRLFKSSDRDECLAIYRANEAGRFPEGFVSYFEDFLDRVDYLKIVLCDKDHPVAVGGIGLTPFLTSHCGWLVFGVVSPAFHGCGLGTALLLSRVALLPEPSPSVRLFMTNVAKSKGFFARFGFASMGKIPSGRGNVRLPCSSTLLDVATWRRCRERIESLGLALPNVSIPQIDLLRRPPGQEEQVGIMAVRDWKISSKLNQAVLIQLAGLIGLFVVHRPYNWLLGWFPIIVGGVLYRQELKRRKALREARIARGA